MPREMPVNDLDRGREAYERRAWLDAYDALTRADIESPLGARDLELLAYSASMVGRMDDHLELLERAHHAHLNVGELLAAAGMAIWIGMTLASRDELGPAGGWFGRAQRLVEREGKDCVEQGWLLVPAALQQLAAGDHQAAFAELSAAVETAERFHDADLLAAAVQFQGLTRIKQGRIEEGLRLLDEAMVGVTAGEVSPVLSGVVYCAVILCCEEAFDTRRAKEWTSALARWCELQPQMVAFTGRCLAHRAGILQLQGAWDDALAEARLARERCDAATNHAAAGQALYQQGELLRLRGAFAGAEEAYREASGYGREPQPGLALLRLAQGDVDAAAAGIRRVLGETRDPLPRAGLLPARAEIALALGEVDEAREASTELWEIAASSGSAMLAAMAAQVRGGVELADGDARAALVSARRAWQTWQELEAPYQSALSRLLVGQACEALGDRDAAALELEAARAGFQGLGAKPDIARLDSITASAPVDAHGLSPRELEVLRLVAAGRTNRQIAAALVVSEHTVARHMQNIFAKLGVSSRTAATAFAFERHLV
jgi:ATP/maltotriose-dependent transcriptional regulator MalT